MEARFIAEEEDRVMTVAERTTLKVETQLRMAVMGTITTVGPTQQWRIADYSINDNSSSNNSTTTSAVGVHSFNHRLRFADCWNSCMAENEIDLVSNHEDLPIMFVVHHVVPACVCWLVSCFGCA